MKLPRISILALPILSFIWLTTPIAMCATPKPNFAEVSYGPDERNVMDVWLAKTDEPAPCILYIHGGGWVGGDKSKIGVSPTEMMEKGISVVSINYRYLPQTIIDSGSNHGTGPVQPRGDYSAPPVLTPVSDAARALQFIRSQASEWNIDPERIAVSGGSAGACSSLWLIYHDDLADPQSDDPIARQSTKPYCAAVNNAQTTLDVDQILEWIPNGIYGGHAFGYLWDRSDKTVEIRSFQADRASVEEWIAEYSPYALVTADDPPVYYYYKGDIPEKGKIQKDPTHTSNYGLLISEKLDELGVPYAFVHDGVENPRFKDCAEYLVYALTQKDPGMKAE